MLGPLETELQRWPLSSERAVGVNYGPISNTHVFFNLKISYKDVETYTHIPPASTLSLLNFLIVKKKGFHL